jgi:hypothetical protein
MEESRVNDVVENEPGRAVIYTYGTMMRVLPVVLLGLLLGAAPPQAGQPINAMCPVKPRMKARASNIVVYKGQVIGLCCSSCVPLFKENPRAYVANIPEFKMPEEKPGPCACDHTVKGWYCLDCKKELAEHELKNGSCPTCEKKPVKTDFCSKTASGQKTPDHARCTYECSGCGEKAEFEGELKHKDDCKKKTSALKKVCSKSGTAPHVTLPKD